MIAAAPVPSSTAPAGPDTRTPGRADGPPPITLKVQDVTASRRFYAELLGFVSAAGWGYSDCEAVLVSPLLANGFRSIILTRATRPGAVTGLRLELETTSELLDRYILARLLGAPTSPLVARGRLLATSIHDPDGHRIDLCASNVEDSPRTSEGRRARPAVSRWARDADEPARRHGPCRAESGGLEDTSGAPQD